MDGDWHELGNCFYHTGYTEEHLDYVWKKYCEDDLTAVIKVKRQLLQGLKFIHRSSRWRQADYDLKCSTWSVSRHVLPGLEWLATVLNEIHWEDRLSPYNHTEHFPLYVTGVVDTTPVIVWQPTDPVARRLLYNPKYGHTVYKLQIGVDFLGRIILFSGPHFGTSYDGHIWNYTANLHRMENWEYFLGDGHYGCCMDVIAPPTQPPNGHMNEQDYLMYTIMQHYRSRVEHINASFKCHGAFQTPFRGSVESLQTMCTVTAHLTNISLHQSLRYHPVGPWSHNPTLFE